MKESNIKRLEQKKNLEALLKYASLAEMITVYYSESSEENNKGIYCALIPSSEIKKYLADFSWDLSHGSGYPDSSIYYENKVEILNYHRYGNNNGIEPFIIDREFYGIHPDYREIIEEFRLFHRLYHDVSENRYIKIDDSGSEDVIAIIEDNKIRIRLKEICQFLAVKEMHLSIQFDYVEYTQLTLSQLGLSMNDNKEVRNDTECWSLSFGEGRGVDYKGFSRLLGKKMIVPLPKSKSGIYSLPQKGMKQYADFIIKIDENGDNITNTSNPELLANNFGANPEALHYLTPVHFRKTVLDKYYKQSSKFTVQDNYLCCGTLWGLQIDNHHLDKVCVWLGDLGRDLPYEEQLHWKSHNIIPNGDISDVYFSRQILSEFTDSRQLDHIFIKRYYSLNEVCSKSLKWQILLPLNPDDLHHLSSIRIPATDEQSDFDEMILAITKILVDSLNEEMLNTLIPTEDSVNIKGSISRLEKVFQILKIEEHKQHIEFLRKLQNLRSSGAAHRKGSNYHKIAKEFGITSSSLVTVFQQILKNANECLKYLEKIIKDGALNINKVAE